MRVVVKVGTSTLTHATGRSNIRLIEELCKVLSDIKNAGHEVTLTDTEFSILEYLLSKRGQTVTAAEMYEAVWREKFLPGSGNTVMVHVLNLRRKIEETPSNPKIIRTVWGRGYQID